MLIAPEFSRKIVGFPFRLPVEDPIIYGALAGIWTTIGLLCIAGLRSPLKFLPIFAIQFIYKCAWFTFVFFPLIFAGEFPNHGWASAVGNFMWKVLDVMAIPWGYLLARDTPLVGTTTRSVMKIAPSQDFVVTP